VFVGHPYPFAHRTSLPTLRETAEEFLAQPRLAVAGVSRDRKQPANLIYRRLRATGHQVFAINPTPTRSREIAATPTSRRSRTNSTVS
jgi:predicted CoA-binding protein